MRLPVTLKRHVGGVCERGLLPLSLLGVLLALTFKTRRHGLALWGASAKARRIVCVRRALGGYYVALFDSVRGALARPVNYRTGQRRSRVLGHRRPTAFR